MIFQKTDFPLHKYISGLLLLLVVATVTSKTGMNLLTPILIIYSLFFYFRNKNSLPPVVNTLFISSFSIYALGTIGSYFGHMDINDLVEFARKNSFLLILPLLAVFLSNQKNRDIACYSFLSACTLSALYGIYIFSVINNFNINIRVNGFLEYSRHTNVMLLGIAIGLSYLTTSLNKKAKGILILSTLLLILSMIISGTRAGYICLAIMLPTIVIVQYRRYIPYIMIVTIALIVSTSFLFPKQANHVVERVISIVNTKTDSSNTARIGMWKGAISYLELQTKNDLSKFVFGSGMINSELSYSNYILQLSNKERAPYEASNGEWYGGSDFHNSILDLTFKSGIAYSVIFSIGLLAIFSLSLKAKYREDPSIRCSLYYLIGLFLLIQFYTMFQDYSMIATSVALALILGRYIELSQHHEPKI